MSICLYLDPTSYMIRVYTSIIPIEVHVYMFKHRSYQLHYTCLYLDPTSYIIRVYNSILPVVLYLSL